MFQRGRSMVEMLGVLAVIGVLSIGGLFGYSFAMSKYHANQTWQDVMLRATSVITTDGMEYAGVDEEIPLTEMGPTTPSGYPASAFKLSEDGFVIDVDNIPERVCAQIIRGRSPVPTKIEVDHLTVEEYDTSLCQSGEQMMSFYFNADDINPCDATNCDSPYVCVNGRCTCPADSPEGYDVNTCACPSGLNNVDGVCQECAWDTDCSGGKYCLSRVCTCPTNTRLCGDECIECNGQGLSGEVDPDTCACKCLEGTDEETCACPSGSIYMDDQCQKFECKNGTPETRSYDCYLNGKECGTSCTQDGRECFLGFCRPEDCPVGTTFRHADGKGFRGYGYCKDAQNRMCVNYYGTGYICSNDQYDGCCNAYAFGVCAKGNCYDPNQCSQYGEGAYYTKSTDRLGGCRFPNLGIWCYIANGTWTCTYADSLIVCGKECADPRNCGTCNQPCPSGSYPSAPNRCLKCLDGSQPTIQSNEYYACSGSKNSLVCETNGDNCYVDDEVCGRGCNGMGSCHTGDCRNPSCPAGTTWKYSSVLNRLGCISDDGNMHCCTHADYRPAMCYYNGALCGYSCSYDGQCQNAVLSQCNGGKCVQGQPITNDCDTVNCTPQSVERGWCCASGHTFINGGCTMISCPGDKIPNESGFCVCPEGTTEGTNDTCSE